MGLQGRNGVVDPESPLRGLNPRSSAALDHLREFRVSLVYFYAKVQNIGRVALTLAVLSLTALGLGRQLDQSFSFERLLRTAMLGTRPWAGRPSWDLGYAPYASAHFCADAGPVFDSHPQLRRAEVRTIQAEARASARDLHALGIIHLFHGSAESATTVLGRAAVLAPRDAGILADLALAHLARAQREGKTDALLAGLEAADRAVAVAPNSPAGRFDRALILEELGLSTLARSAWQDYLAIDASSPWAQEARQHLGVLAIPASSETWQEVQGRLDGAAEAGYESIVARIVAQYPGRARIHIEDDLLTAWAEADLAGKGDDADRWLRTAGRIGEVLARRGEHLPADAVAAIERAAGTSVLSGRLAEGHLAYGRGRALYGDRKYEQARPEFERARRVLGQAGSPVAALAALHLAILRYHRFELEPARQALDRILREPGKESYPGLRGRLLWARGLAELAGGSPAASFATYLDALTSFETCDHVEEIGAVHALLAENLRYLGESRGAWDHLLRALEASYASNDASRLQVALNEAAHVCIEAGQHLAARDFQDEMVRVANAAGEPTALAHALVRRDGTRHQLGVAGGTEDLAAARRLLWRIPDLSQRNRVATDLAIAEAEAVALENPEKAIGQFTAALRFYADRGAQFPLGSLYLARARAQVALGKIDEGEADLSHGIEEYERQRRRISEERFKIAFFDRSRELFEEMQKLQVGRGRIESAFDYAERQRARTLLDHMDTLFTRSQRELLLAQAEEPLSSRDISHNLPGEVAIVEYAVLNDRVLAWVLRHDRVRMIETRIVRSAVESTVSTFRKKLERASTRESWATASAALHDLLLRPLLSYLEPRDLVVLVPDGPLHQVPFAALLDSRSGRYFLEDHAIAYAPSATLYLRTVELSRGAGPLDAATVFAVGNPRFQVRPGRRLQDLPYAAQEAAVVAGRFPGSELLRGSEATREAFLDGAAHHPILHFAGHAVVNREFPFLSYLLLAPSPEGAGGELYAHQIYRLHLDHTRLVVLAACSSAGGPSVGEGVLSLARAFLAAGVPTVMASLWDVGDRESGRLLDLFYLALGRGDDPVQALRTAQLELLSEDSQVAPASWAGFQVIGATN